MSGIPGRIHSVESCGTVDGPGVRFIAFLQGCALRCAYCHNLDTRDPRGGRAVTAEDLFSEILTYKSFMQASGGGVTFSGGEPCLQPEFLERLIDLCRAEGIHTAVDTAGSLDLRVTERVLRKADLVLLDIKSFHPEAYKKTTGGAVDKPVETARFLDREKIPVWIRFVLVPGWTDSDDNVRGLAQFISSLSNVERVQILPYHKLGEYKWEALGVPSPLKEVPVPTKDEVRRVQSLFADYGITAE